MKGKKAIQKHKENAPIVAPVTVRIGEQPLNNGTAVLVSRKQPWGNGTTVNWQYEQYPAHLHTCFTWIFMVSAEPTKMSKNTNGNKNKERVVVKWVEAPVYLVK